MLDQHLDFSRGKKLNFLHHFLGKNYHMKVKDVYNLSGTVFDGECLTSRSAIAYMASRKLAAL